MCAMTMGASHAHRPAAREEHGGRRAEQAQPVPAVDAAHQHSPGTLDRHELGRLRAAAGFATMVFPGPVGELLARELGAHADLGYRFGFDALMPRLAAEVLRCRSPRAGQAEIAS